jgi:D-glycero-alpha-D-manno-heptose 1-phosphate guanylyltransferase
MTDSHVAVILAGGLGTRLRAVVPDRPKPMAEIEPGRPFVDYLVEKLVESGFSRIIFCVAYMKESVMEYYSRNRRTPVEFVHEETPLGTAGALKNAERVLPDRFAVLNGDSYIKLNYSDLFKFHEENNSDLTMTLSRVSGNRFGRVILREKRVITFGGDQPDFDSDLANAGVYVFERTVLNSVPERKYSLEQDLIPELIKKNKRVMGYVSDNDFIDMGVPESYEYLRRNPGLLK